jgi:hypothetical protein
LIHLPIKDLDPQVDDPNNPGVEDVGTDNVGVDSDIEEEVDCPANEHEQFCAAEADRQARAQIEDST